MCEYDVRALKSSFQIPFEWIFQHMYTAFHPVCRKVLKVLNMRIWGVPQAGGLLLPKQAGGTPQMLTFKTLRMTGRPTVYMYVVFHPFSHAYLIPLDLSQL